MDVLDNTPKRKLKEENTLLAMGILSIIFVSIIGLLIAVGTLIKVNTTLQEYHAHPNIYREKSYKKVKAARILALSSFEIKIILLILISALA